MDSRRIRRVFFLALASVGIAACGTILGDFPDGRLGEDDAAKPDEASVPPDAPAGPICTVPSGDILDMAIDATDIFWVRAPPSGGGFAIEACSKNGAQNGDGGVRQIATAGNQPEGFAVSDDYVFWSIDLNYDPHKIRGIWRADKKGGPPVTARWIDIDRAGPMAFANGALYAGAHTKFIYRFSPGTGEQSLLINTNSDPTSIAASESYVYWSAADAPGPATSDPLAPRILTVPLGPPDAGLQPTQFAGQFPVAPTFLSYDEGALYWAVVQTGGPTTIASRCPDGCAATTEIVTQPQGFVALAVRNKGIYWTANEGDAGVVHACQAVAHCQQDGSVWSGTNSEVSLIALDDNGVYFVAKNGTEAGTETHIMRKSR